VNEIHPADEWDALLGELGLSDPYYLRRYVEASSFLDTGAPVLLEHGGAVMPCIVREIPDSDRHDVITPYGYGGPVGRNVAGFYDAYGTWCRERGVVSTFVRFHPLFENHHEAGPGFHVAFSNPTVGWRLESDLLAAMHGKHRNTVRKAIKSGVTIATRSAPDLEAFVVMYERTMQRQEAASYYVFPLEYWALLTGLGDRLVLFDALAEGEVVASALCLRGDRWLHYHLGATDDLARDLGASNLLLYEAALWAQAEGLAEFHLGGGAGGRESLYAFKQRFSPEGRREFWTGKAVHDLDAYRRLSHGRDVDYEGFFPAYRG
jgi:serine/alanine adding enzyme